MRKLENLLWSDLKTDEDRVEYIESGHARQSGLLSKVLEDDFVQALKSKIGLRELRRFILVEIGKELNEKI